MPSAGSTTVTTAEVIYSGAAHTVSVTCVTGSTSNLLVNVPGLHATNEWFVLTEGDTQEFTFSGKGLHTVIVKSAGADADVAWGVTKQTERFEG